jgi:GNAT superfamily N-acetyltransferase
MYKFRHVRGVDVPQEAHELTRGASGLMSGWLHTEAEHMIATLLYQNNTLIGWCCAVRVRFFGHYTKTVEISTFVHPKYRGKGLAKRLLDKTLWMLRMVEPKTIVRYGAPGDDAGYFNKTYDESIKKRGLRPKRYFCVG